MSGFALYYAHRSRIPRKEPVGDEPVEDSSVNGWMDYKEDAKNVERPSRFVMTFLL